MNLEQYEMPIEYFKYHVFIMFKRKVFIISHFSSHFLTLIVQETG